MPRPPTPEELRPIAEEDALAAEIAALLPGAESPYFARLRVRTAAGQRDVLLATRTLASPTAMLVDWQTAPLAAVFLESRPGDDYEHEHAGRTLAGKVLRRHLVCFHGRVLTEIHGDDFILRRGDHGWLADDPAPRLHPRPAAARTRPLSPAHVQLDPAQRAAVDLPITNSLLVLGEAGFGKTTVALHRLARLVRAADPPHRVLVLVPTPGLQRLVVHMLGELGVADRVQVSTFNQWISAEAWRLFPALPRRLSSDPGTAITRLKRHPALRTVFDKIVAGTPAMRDVRRGYRDAPETIRELLLHLFGDHDLLADVVQRGALPNSTIPDVLAHTRVQFTPTSERALRHVDRARLQTLDGRPLDADTPLKNAETIDREDFAVIFALHRRFTGGDTTRHGTLTHYQHILLDEAQELAPIEFEMIRHALTPTGTLIIAGDERQQVDATTAFVGWPATLDELGKPDATVVSLAVSYRCPPAIEAAARHILDPASSFSATDPSLLLTRHANSCHLLTDLADTLLALTTDDPQLSIAIVHRHPELAERLHARLAPLLRSRLVIDGAFSFRPGVDITCVQAIKGLEFNLVIVPDADARTYPDDPVTRRALYVAMTRATDRCWLATPGPWSPLLTSITA